MTSVVRGGVSVLIPVRNGERYLGATLESVLAQTLPPVEIIVVDDGSTDGSRALAGRCGSRVTVVDSPGQGASAARTHASQLARGEFFQYLDADDLLRPDALATRVAALHAATADVAISDWRRLEERAGGWVAVKTESGNLAGLAPPWDLRVFEGFWAPPAAVLYRRSVFERVGPWHEGLPVIQDARFLLDAVRLGARPVHVAGSGADYRQHATGSLSTRNPPKFWRDILQNALEIEAIWTKAGRLDTAHRRALADSYAVCARTAVAADAELFARSCAELRRFPKDHASRFGRVAAWLSAWCGDGVARAVLKVAHR